MANDLYRQCPTCNCLPVDGEPHISGCVVGALEARIIALSSERPSIDEPTAQLLAAISVASMQNTRESAKERIGRDSPFWTQTYADVCAAVDREMLERERADAALSASRSTNDAQDAARYRWLRDPRRLHCITVEQFGSVRSTLHSEALDKAVDESMARSDRTEAHGR